VALQGDFCPDYSTRDEFFSCLTMQDLVLSSQADDNVVTAIISPCHVIYRRPDADNANGNGSSGLPKMPFNTFCCRYSLAFGGDAEPGKIFVTPYSGENDDWSLMPTNTANTPASNTKGSNNSNNNKRPRHARQTLGGGGGSNNRKPVSQDGSEDGRGSVTMGSNSSDDDDDDSSSVDDSDSGAFGKSGGALLEGEGSIEKRDIRVGPEHQAVVPPFIAPNQAQAANRVVSSSRNPILVWQQGRISTEDLDNYFTSVADILNPYLKENGLTTQDPYSPLPTEEMEATVRKAGSHGPPTLSSICTTSSLSTTRNHLQRECDADALLEILSQHDYNVQSALAAIEASPEDCLTIWTLAEKELFNSGFRRYSGSLRMISKGIAPSKDFKDIVDYHYRFKIPDQFRRFQDKKREQAVRMMECIETRRYLNSISITQATAAATAAAAAQENGTAKQAKAGEW
jgi:hypothetical protein